MYTSSIFNKCISFLDYCPAKLMLILFICEELKAPLAYFTFIKYCLILDHIFYQRKYCKKIIFLITNLPLGMLFNQLLQLFLYYCKF